MVSELQPAKASSPIDCNPSGILTVVTDKNEEITLHEGECLPELVGKYHYGKNTGNEPVELIVFYIGEKGTPLSVNK